MRRLLLILASLIAALPGTRLCTTWCILDNRISIIEFVSGCAVHCNATHSILKAGETVILLCSDSWHGNGSLLQNGITSQAAERGSLERENVGSKMIKFLIKGSQEEDEGPYSFCFFGCCSAPVTITVTKGNLFTTQSTGS